MVHCQEMSPAPRADFKSDLTQICNSLLSLDLEEEDDLSKLQSEVESSAVVSS